MISFFCRQCRSTVRVTDACRSKRGRCPRCHALIEVPLVSDPVAEHTQEIRVAAGQAPSPRKAANLQATEKDSSSDTDIDEIAPVDPNDETNRMEAVTESQSALSPWPRRASAMAFEPAAPPRRSRRRTLLIAAASLLLIISAAIVVVVTRKGSGASAGSPAISTPAASPTSEPVEPEDED